MLIFNRSTGGFFMQKKQATKLIAPVFSLKKIRNYENRCTNLQFFILKQTQ
jgi:hypothetical protein